MDIFCRRIARAGHRVGVTVQPERHQEHPGFIWLSGSECAALARAVRNISPIPDDAEAILALLDPRSEGYGRKLLSVPEVRTLVNVLEAASGVVEHRRRSRATGRSSLNRGLAQPLRLPSPTAEHVRRVITVTAPV
jgi:hypothetical protein